MIIKGEKMKETIYLEITSNEDKATVAAILVMNGYTVKKTMQMVNNRKKAVLEAWKED